MHFIIYKAITFIVMVKIKLLTMAVIVAAQQKENYDWWFKLVLQNLYVTVR